jgi:hypothetical protein
VTVHPFVPGSGEGQPREPGATTAASKGARVGVQSTRQDQGKKSTCSDAFTDAARPALQSIMPRLIPR